MSITSMLNITVDINEVVETQNARGAPQRTEVLVQESIPAAIKRNSGDTEQEFDRSTTRRRYRFYLNTDYSLQEDIHVIAYGGRGYVVKDVYDVSGQGRLWQVDTEQEATA